MSLDQFIYLWKGASWDRAECKQRDNDGNPLEIWFLREKKLVLKVFISYDKNGDWESIYTEKPKPEAKTTKKVKGELYR